jgi:hypothetical protein
MLKKVCGILMVLALSGCGCTDSYLKSFVTLGIGYSLCMNSLMQDGCGRCFGPDGHNPECGCSKSCRCWGKGKKAK